MTNFCQPSLFEELDFIEYIESLLAKQETVDLEFKSAKEGFPGSFWETYSSFANTEGGVIVLGVKEKHGDIIVDGLSDEQIEEYKKYFWNNVNNKQNISINLLRDDDVKSGTYRNKKLLLFEIPRADRTQRPVHRTLNPIGNTFKRNHEGDYKCTEIEVKRMIADSDLSLARDGRILDNYTMDDIDLDSLRQYRQLFAVSKPSHAWLALDDMELLQRLGAYRKNRTTGKEGFTLAGMLMFGKSASITDPECAPNYFPDFREELSSDLKIRWTDRIYPDGTWEANLFQFYRRVYAKLTTSIPTPFAIQQGIRIDESPMHIALREAFVNTLVHCDYSADGNIVIEQKKDRLIFSNPGTLLISKQQYYQGGSSVCRNTALQQMFMLIGSAEKAGSGVDKILAGWEDAKWKRPYIEESDHPDKVVLTMPTVSLLSPEVIKELQATFGPEIIRIDRDKLLTLATCYSEGSISNDRLQSVIDKHSADITKLLKELCKDGYIIPSGNGRGTKYHLNMNFNSPNDDTSTIINDDTSVNNDDTSIAANDDTSANIVCDVGRCRLSREKLEQQILARCKDYMSLEEIASAINRSVPHLKNRILPKMIQDGLLERQYPDIPNHPMQKFRAVLPEG